MSTPNPLINPCGMAYASTEGVDQYGGKTAVIVTGRGNRYHEDFQKARAKGAEILAYINPTDLLVLPSNPLDEQIRRGMEAWPYAPRFNYYDPAAGQYCPIADMRAGSPSMDHFVSIVEGVMRDGKVDGVLLDCVGEHMWTAKFAWDTWPAWEQGEWSYGNVDLVHRIDVLRRRINPGFIVVNNNSWGDGWARAGEQFVNGRMIEHHSSTSAYQVNQSKRPFGNPEKRRVLVLAKPADVDGWLAVVGGPTHVARTQPAGQTPHVPAYAKVTLPPPCGFTDLEPPP